MSRFIVRRMGTADMARAAEWATAEGWNPGLDDGLAFQAADPEGFLVGELDGMPVGCISVVRFGRAFGFLGFYIMTPPARGQGYGIRIWRDGMAHLAGRLVGLDGVVAQQANYVRSGFSLAWQNQRHQGEAPVAGDGAPAGVRLVDARTLPFDRLAAYDARFFPAPRNALLSLWLGLPRHISVAALRDGEIAGFGTIRPAREGFKVAPLYAADARIAEALFAALVARAGAAGQPVALDVPGVNPAATALARGFGLAPVFETARMYTGPAPDLDRGAYFGVMSFELG